MIRASLFECGGVHRRLDLLALLRMEQHRQELRHDGTPEPEPLETNISLISGNMTIGVAQCRRTFRTATKPTSLISSTDGSTSPLGHQDWKSLIKTLSFENKGSGKSFMRYLLMRQSELHGTPILVLSHATYFSRFRKYRQYQ